MYKFSDLIIGDLFNTLSARWVKTSATEAIVVMSAVQPLGEINVINPDATVVVLWSCLLLSNAGETDEESILGTAGNKRPS